MFVGARFCRDDAPHEWVGGVYVRLRYVREIRNTNKLPGRGTYIPVVGNCSIIILDDSLYPESPQRWCPNVEVPHVFSGFDWNTPQLTRVFFFFASLLLSSSIRRRFSPPRSSGQAVVTGVVPSPPRYVPSFLSLIGGILTARRFSPNVANSRSRAVR